MVTYCEFCMHDINYNNININIRYALGVIHSAIGPRLGSARRCGSARRKPTQYFNIYLQEFKQQEEHFMRKNSG